MLDTAESSCTPARARHSMMSAPLRQGRKKDQLRVHEKIRRIRRARFVSRQGALTMVRAVRDAEFASLVSYGVAASPIRLTLARSRVHARNNSLLFAFPSTTHDSRVPQHSRVSLHRPNRGTPYAIKTHLTALA